MEDTAENRVRWNAFLQGVPGSSFYQRFEWRTIVAQEFGHETFYLAAEQDGRLTGVLPLVLIRSRLFGTILCSMPFLNFGGPIAENAAAEEALVAEGCDLAARLGADYLEIRSAHPVAGDLAVSEHKVSLTIRLDASADAIWDSFKSKHRTNIRRVYKNDVSVVSGHRELLDVFYDIMCESWRSLGTPIFRKSFFERILATFGDEIRLFVASQGSTPLAATLNGHYAATVEGMWAGNVPQGRSLQANYVLYWEMVKDACERGFELFHLGRSTVETGGESFKKKWNAEARQLYWQYYMPKGGAMPQLNVENKKFALAIAAWRRCPLWLTNTVGPWLSRSIP